MQAICSRKYTRGETQCNQGKKWDNNINNNKMINLSPETEETEMCVFRYNHQEALFYMGLLIPDTKNTFNLVLL